MQTDVYAKLNTNIDWWGIPQGFWDGKSVYLMRDVQYCILGQLVAVLDIYVLNLGVHLISLHRESSHKHRPERALSIIEIVCICTVSTPRKSRSGTNSINSWIRCYYLRIVLVHWVECTVRVPFKWCTLLIASFRSALAGTSKWCTLSSYQNTCIVRNRVHTTQCTSTESQWILVENTVHCSEISTIVLSRVVSLRTLAVLTVQIQTFSMLCGARSAPRLWLLFPVLHISSNIAPAAYLQVSVYDAQAVEVVHCI